MVWKLLAVVLLVGANAFFVAAEFGMVAVRRTRIDELVTQGSRRAQSTRKALQELNLMLSGCQLGITFSSLGLGAIGEPVLATIFADLFAFLARPFNLIAAHSAAVAVAFIIITALHVILGELVPKNLAIAVPERTALWVGTPIRAFTFVFRPLIWLFNESANATLRAMGVQPSPGVSVIHTPDELAIIVEESRRGGSIDPRHSLLLTRTLDFVEKKVVEAMIPRTATHAVESTTTVEEILDLVEETGYSRFPVWRERPDEFVGVIHLKDILKGSREDRRIQVEEVMREPLLVPESLSLSDVLIQMQRTRSHFAIVLDEFGATSGIITLEDILEELVGEIMDEYDVREFHVRKVEGGVRVPGTTRPDELAEITGLNLPEGEYETIAGFILARLGRLAHRGDEVGLDGWKIRVANVRRRRILSVDVQPPA